MKRDSYYGDFGEHRKKLEEARQARIRAEEAEREKFSRNFQRFCGMLGPIGKIQE